MDAKTRKKLEDAERKQRAKEEKRKKQEQKAMKKDTKKKEKERSAAASRGLDVDSDSDEDIERIVSEFTERALVSAGVGKGGKGGAAAAAAQAQAQAQGPPPIQIEKLTGLECSALRTRAAFTMVAAPAFSDVVLFGGEFYDGAVSKCYDDVFRYAPTNPREWRRITSPRAPPPRCAHAACATPTHMYIFGGEFSTATKFYHYGDLWRLDLKTNVWSFIDATNGPPPRSGHRMVVWRNYLVVFGGFYEASRGVRWYDDLFFFDMRTEKWVKPKPVSGVAQRPSARSGFVFAAHPTRDTLFLYGGYAKVSASSNAQRGRQLDDMWALHLTPPKQESLASSSSAAAAAAVGPEIKWEIIARRGTAPSRRSGMAAAVHRSRILVFGGVADTETANDVVGVFKLGGTGAR